MQKVFDITNAGGEWLCQEDKDLYYRQILSDGRVGYTTQKLAPASTIYPSKKRKIPKPNDFPPTSIQGQTTSIQNQKLRAHLVSVRALLQKIPVTPNQHPNVVQLQEPQKW